MIYENNYIKSFLRTFDRVLITNKLTKEHKKQYRNDGCAESAMLGLYSTIFRFISFLVWYPRFLLIYHAIIN